MALFPCDARRHRYPGKANKVYVGWMAGGQSERQAWNLCPAHLEYYEKRIQDTMQLIEIGGVLQTDETAVPETCERCKLVPATVTWFAHVYDRTREPHVYATGVCAQCNQAIAGLASLTA